jgi:TolB-like protein
MRNLIAELQRRSVFRVGAAYAVIGWIVAQVANVFFPALHLPEWTVTFVVVLLILGFPLALFLAWAYEITPEGIRREVPATAAPASATHDPTARKLDWLVIALLLVAIGLYLAERIWTRQWSQPARVEVTAGAVPMVAVLPFENLGRSEDEYFADGITDEIIQRLVRVKGLGVIARSSAVRYKGSGKSVAEIAEELGVDFVLDGTVRWAHLPDGSSRVRITPQLVRVPATAPLWSDAYEQPLGNVFELQAAIAERVVEALGVNVLEQDQQAIRAESTTSVDAYQYYLQGRYFYNNRIPLGGAPALERAIEFFRRAVQVDPAFAEAWAAKASTMALLFGLSIGADGDDYENGGQFEQVFSTAAHALELDPGLAEPYAARALAHLVLLDWVEAERQVQQAIEREPRHVGTLVWYGILLVLAGHSSEALDVLQTASRLDPVNAVTAHWLADALRNTGRLEESRAEAQRSVDLGMLTSGIGIYAYYLLQEDWEEAAEYLVENITAQGITTDFVPVLVEAVRDPERIPEALAMLEATAREHPELLTYAYLYDLRDPDPLFDAIEVMIGQGQGTWAFWRMWEPQFTHLRNHPRFGEIAAQVGLLDYWREVAWPDQCRPEQAGFVCD